MLEVAFDSEAARRAFSQTHARVTGVAHSPPGPGGPGAMDTLALVGRTT